MTEAKNNERGGRRLVQGVVVSDRMQQTITVVIDRTYRHPKYGKYVRKSKKYHAHDEDSVARIGDLVELVQCRPLSRLKRWRLLRVVTKGSGAQAAVNEAGVQALVGGER